MSKTTQQVQFEFSFIEVETILAKCQSVTDAKRGAFQARIKNLLKLGLLPESLSGRGRAAVYSVGDLYLLALAVEMAQLGLGPTRAIEAIRGDMFAVAQGALIAARSGPPDGEFQNPMFYYLDPACLSDLMMERGEDRASASFFYGGLGIVKERIDEWGRQGLARWAIIGISPLLWDLSAYASNKDRSAFYLAVADWATELVGKSDGDS